MDSGRFYLTGLSMGGNIWSLGISHDLSGSFCGCSSDSWPGKSVASRLNQRSAVVPFQHSQDMVNGVKSSGKPGPFHHLS